MGEKGNDVATALPPSSVTSGLGRAVPVGTSGAPTYVPPVGGEGGQGVSVDSPAKGGGNKEDVSGGGNAGPGGGLSGGGSSGSGENSTPASNSDGEQSAA